jgi:hypothetical protein
MTIEEYRAAPGLNFSVAKWLLTTPFHFKTMLATEVEETLAMRMGAAVDEWVLSGRVRPHAIMPPDIATLTGKGSRAAKQAWVKEQEAKGFTVYKREDWDKQSAMQRALERSPDFQSILSACPERQLPVFASYRGIPMKALLDMAGRDAKKLRCFGDLKCILDASPRGFGKRAYANHLDLQIVMYQTVLALSEGLEAPPLPFWVAVESSGVPAVSVFSVPLEAMESGQRKLDKCVDLYLSCSESGLWPAYGSGWLTPEWPRWAETETGG